MVSEDILQQVVSRIVDGFDPERVILFGSQARNEAELRSDVDLLVLCPNIPHRRSLMVAIDRSLTGLGIARDIVVLTPEEFDRDKHIPGTLANHAWHEGRILFERVPA